MRRLIIIFALMISLGAWAQKGLWISDFFNHPAPYGLEAVETRITGEGDRQLDGIDYYRSMSLKPFKGQDEAVESLVRRDGIKATSRETKYSDSRLNYAFYALPPRNDKNRYILYLNQLPTGGQKVIVIYMEGTATPEQIKNMLKNY